MDKYFYGFDMTIGKGSSTGEPNKKTGRFSIHGHIVAFKSKKERDEWEKTSEWKIPCSKRKLRSFRYWQTMKDFIDDLCYSEFQEG